ncbi:MAG TPA: SelB C-terminal domain-containing protein, partial [Herpetosiphonaceae bacterium]
PDHRPQPTDEQRRRAAAILAAFRASPAAPPGRELLDTLDPELLAWLAESRQLVRVAADIWFLADTYQAMRGWVEGEVGGGGSVTLAGFRDRWQTTRRYAQAVLEHLDEQRVTRRVGDERVAW